MISVPCVPCSVNTASETDGFPMTHPLWNQSTVCNETKMWLLLTRIIPKPGVTAYMCSTPITHLTISRRCLYVWQAHLFTLSHLSRGEMPLGVKKSTLEFLEFLLHVIYGTVSCKHKVQGWAVEVNILASPSAKGALYGQSYITSYYIFWYFDRKNSSWTAKGDYEECECIGEGGGASEALCKLWSIDRRNMWGTAGWLYRWD